MISIWTLISGMLWVAATTWYLTRKRSAGTIKKLHSINNSLEGKNNDLRKALSEIEADREEIKQIAEIAMHEWKFFMRECHNLRDLLRIQEGKTKSAKEAAQKLVEKIKFWKLEHAKDRAIVADMVQKLQAKDRENIRLSEFILKLNSKIKHYRLKMRKLYSEPNEAETQDQAEVWNNYDAIMSLIEEKKAPNTAISEASTINRGMLRLPA